LGNQPYIFSPAAQELEDTTLKFLCAPRSQGPYICRSDAPWALFRRLPSFYRSPQARGETQCITGRVLRFEAGSRGVHYLNFCEDYRLCPFSVVIFSYDLKKVGDVRQLEGKDIEIRGELKEYDGRAEIILENARQLGGQAARLPPLPKELDVEQRGHFSAGKFRAPHSRSTRKKRGRPTLPADIPEDVESD